MSWSKRFDKPVTLPDGQILKTLSDARAYMLTLSESELATDKWQTAGEALLMAAKGEGPTLHALIGLNRAIHGPLQKELRRKRAKKYTIIRSLK